MLNICVSTIKRIFCTTLCCAESLENLKKADIFKPSHHNHHSFKNENNRVAAATALRAIHLLADKHYDIAFHDNKMASAANQSITICSASFFTRFSKRVRHGKDNDILYIGNI